MLQEGLVIKDLVVQVDEKNILNGVDLHVKLGETHAIMGLNGSGKTTLAQVIAGSPNYSVKDGIIEFDGKNLSNLEPHQRAKLGIFLSFQHPLEISGVNIANFLRMIYTKKFEQSIIPIRFRALLEEKMKLIDMKADLMERYLNAGFSGGEKKKLEILQMLVLEPRLVILDEVDSGLDIDALKSVANGVNWLRRKNPQTAFVIITHYARILDHIKPDFVHVMQNGRIVKSGGFELALELEKSGYKESL